MLFLARFLEEYLAAIFDRLLPERKRATKPFGLRKPECRWLSTAHRASRIYDVHVETLECTYSICDQNWMRAHLDQVTRPVRKALHVSNKLCRYLNRSKEVNCVWLRKAGVSGQFTLLVARTLPRLHRESPCYEGPNAAHTRIRQPRSPVVGIDPVDDLHMDA